MIRYDYAHENYKLAFKQIKIASYLAIFLIKKILAKITQIFK